MASDIWLVPLVRALVQAPPDWTPYTLAEQLGCQVEADLAGSTEHRSQVRLACSKMPPEVRGEGATTAGPWRYLSFKVDAASPSARLAQINPIVGRPLDEFGVLPPSQGGAEHRWRVPAGRFWVRVALGSDTLREIGLSAGG